MASLPAFPSPRYQTRDLPLFDWAEGLYLTLPDGKKLDRWGDVRKACKILRCSRQDVYDLIEAGMISAYKVKPHRPNAHWHVDLLSVWEHKQGQLRPRGGDGMDAE